MTDDDIAYCADGCGRLATTECLISVIPTGDQDFIELVELVCVVCERVLAGVARG